MANTKQAESLAKITSVLAREENGNIQINFTIPFSLVKQARDETIVEFAKDIEIPGFRKGKAPLTKVAEKVPQSELIEHSLSHILPKALAEAIEKHKLKIAIYPKFELVSTNEGSDWQIRAVTCELPEVTLGDYKQSLAKLSFGKKKEPSKEEKEQIVIKTLLESIKINIPQILIQEEADSRLANLLVRLEKLGLALESYLQSIGKSGEDLRADYANQAREVLTIDLILSRVAEEEDIKATEKEIEEALKVSSATKPDRTENVESRKRLLASILVRRKALDFLTELV